MSTKKLLITHIDLDGVGSVILSKWLKLNNLFKFDDLWMVDYGFEDDNDLMTKLSEFDEIHMYDISVPSEVLHKWLINKTVLIRDHHISSLWINDLLTEAPSEKLNVTSIVDPSRCGAKLFADWIQSSLGIELPTSIIEFVELVDTYDRWVSDSNLWDEACNLNLLMFDSIYHNYEADTNLEACNTFIFHILDLFNEDHFEFTSIDNLIIDKNKAAINKATQILVDKLVTGVDSRGLKFGVSLLGAKISLACHKFFTELNNDNLEYLIIIYNSYSDGIIGKVSVRSQSDNFDCTELLNIEGHAQAAGGMLTISECELLLTGMYSLKYKDEYKEGEDVLNKL